ncbi:MAG: [protein-PII] uridylyltransferase [Gammaproteobacteria bacterium]|nr:[protein-PII] uridylyltransferase [Gammaproteobacteria bacterium]
MSNANKQVNQNTAAKAVADVLDFKLLSQQLNTTTAGISTKSTTQDLITSEVVNHLKDAVTSIDEGLKQLYQAGADVNIIVYGRANLTDQLIDVIYRYLFKNIDQEIALIAVGGYGRGELHPKSDIDLMVILAEKENQNTKDLLEKILMLLWDIRLEIGHSVRTIEECIEESTNDITVATNIMEARLLAGSEQLFDQMKDQTSADHIWDSKSFFQAKLEEQIQRNRKLNNTAYNLEPNIKESYGGLRDIQMIGWVAKRHFNAGSFYDLVKQGFLLEDELNTLLDGQHLLWRIRCSLHYLAQRREDRLLFDYQRDLALEFGFKENKENPKNEAIEQFMQQYYRTVIELERLNEMLLQHFSEAIIYQDEDQATEIINKNFQVRNGFIETSDAMLFKEEPCAMLEMFLILQDYPDILGVRADTIRQVRKYKYLINDTLRQSTQAKQLFIKIMFHSRGVTHEVRRMNRYGVLAAYIPAFDSIVGRMQYDLFHAFTVDQHTLFVIRNMRRLSVPHFCNEFPLASGIFHHLPTPGLLILAGLFHDIAKGREGDHSEVGAVDAKEFCTAHDFNEKDSELVSWLVQSHLIMSDTAQRKDISDPGVINQFAQYVKTLERLDHLYLLTMCDIRGTNPKLWNDWKDKLLAELYNKTAACLNRGIDQDHTNLQSDREINIQEIQTDSLRQLALIGIDSYQTNKLWNSLNEEYFQSHTPGEIVWHTTLIDESKQKKTVYKPLIKTRIDQTGSSIELLIYMKSREKIFYDIVTVLNNSEVDIVEAQIVNTKDNYALETFRLIPGNVDISELSIAAEQINIRLENILLNASGNHPTTISISRKYKHFSSPTTIAFNETEEKNTTLVKIETINRSGVLENIAKTFVDNQIDILNARIITAGEKAIDYFIVTTLNNTSLNVEQQNTLKQQLEKFL